MQVDRLRVPGRDLRRGRAQRAARLRRGAELAPGPNSHFEARVSLYESTSLSRGVSLSLTRVFPQYIFFDIFGRPYACWQVLDARLCTTDARGWQYASHSAFGLRWRRASYDGECSGKPRDLRESVKLSKVRIGLETTKL